MTLQSKSLFSLDYQTLFQVLPGRYMVFTPDLTIVAVSDDFLRVTSTQRENIIGKEIFSVFPENPDEKNANGKHNFYVSVERVLQNKMPDLMAMQKYDLRRPGDGVYEERYWSLINSPILNAQGNVIFIIQRVEDVTEFVHLKLINQEQDKMVEAFRMRTGEIENELYQHAQELQRAKEAVEIANRELVLKNQELEAFSYSVSHDLRAPVRSIIGFGKILLEDYGENLDAQGKDYLTRMMNAGQKTGQLIDALLQLSRLSRKPIEKNTIDLSAMVKEILNELQQMDPTREVNCKIAHNILTEGDKQFMQIVLQNLIGNAWKYTGRKTKAYIEFGVQKQDHETIYFIRDNGAGFDMSYANKLFGIFQRLHSFAEFEGIGIGLVTAQRIIRRMGGRIWAEGVVDQGATFFFTLTETKKLKVHPNEKSSVTS